MTSAPTVTPASTLAELAAAHAGASRVFHAHRLDFCCAGQRRLDEAAAEAGVGVDTLVAELEAALADDVGQLDWNTLSLGELMDRILARFHEGHRAELPRLLEMARKVEAVHGDRDDAPAGLAAHLELVAASMEEHMQKEEQVLFPMIRQGRGPMAGMPIHCMEAEHDDHGRNLARLRDLAHDFEPPADACNTWRALYLGLAELEREVMAHVHVENHVLFPRALRGA